MRFLLTLPFLALAASPVAADTKAALDLIVDKKTYNDKVPETMLRSDGTLYVIYEGKKHTGTWEYRGGQYCRKIPSFKIDSCQDVVVVKEKDGRIGVEFRNPGEKKGRAYFLK